MTPRERILAALNREVPDRTPTDGWFHQEVQKRLKAHYGTERWGDVLQELGIEGWGGCSPWIEFPGFEARATERPGGLPGSGDIWLDDRTHEDGWGIRHRIGEGGWYEEWVGGPLVDAETVEDVERCPLPGVDQIREPEDYAGQVARQKEDGLFVSSGIPNPYKMAWMLRGMEPISSRKMVPPQADSNRPSLFEDAPVNAPLTCPNISDSRRGSGSAAQFTARYFLSLRWLEAWMALATSSLPVPLSP